MYVKIKYFSFMVSLLIFNVVATLAQTASGIFSQAVIAYEKADYAGTIQLLNTCQALLKTTNPKIESLKTHTYYAMEDWRNAAIAANTYLAITPASNLNSDAHEDLLGIKKQVDLKINTLLNDAESAMQENRMKETASYLMYEDQNLDRKASQMKAEGSRRIYELVKTSTDLSDMEVFLKLHPTSSESSLIKSKINEEIQKRHALIRAAILEVKLAAEPGFRSYRNYQHFGRADELAGQVIAKYSPDDFPGREYERLLAFRKELLVRFNWNKEYFLRRDEVNQYEQLLAKNQAIITKSDRRAENVSSGTNTFMAAALTSLGGMATLVGGYAAVSKDATLAPYKKDLLTYGGAGATIGITWIVLIFKRLNANLTKSIRARQAVSKAYEPLKDLLQKRNEEYEGRPLINTN